jgi:disulfide bond formation protein DsbB
MAVGTGNTVARTVTQWETGCLPVFSLPPNPCYQCGPSPLIGTAAMPTTLPDDKNMLRILTGFSKSRTYWVALIVLGIANLAVALYYQYGKDELPCLLCIHVRLWVSALILLGIVALFVRSSRWLLTGCHLLNTVIMAGLLERSWLLLGTERGTIIATCDFELGMPSWLALDKWFPALYQVQSSCGYTPKLWFGITMAEGLVAMSGVLLAVSAVLLLTSLRKA